MGAIVDRDPARLRDALERRVVRLEGPKRRLLERLALRQLAGGRARGPVLALLGPPGAGKSALAAAASLALDLPLVRVDVSGARSAADIAGQVRGVGDGGGDGGAGAGGRGGGGEDGAGPGRIAAALLRAGGPRAMVLLLAGIDRVAGEGAARALAEVVDPDRRADFADRYLGRRLDLEAAFPIATARHPTDIPAALAPFLEVVPLHGYTGEEKAEIAARRLVREVLDEGGIPVGTVDIEPAALARLVSLFAGEAGVRGLREAIGDLCRRAAARFALGEATAPVTVGPGDVEAAVLGGAGGGGGAAAWAARALHAGGLLASLRRPEVGVATALAWTRRGGELLLVEAIKMGGGHGSVAAAGFASAAVAAEAESALAYVRSRAEELRLDPEPLARLDVHVRLTSATAAAGIGGDLGVGSDDLGLPVLLALVSLLTDRPIRPDLGLAGGLTLRGAVRPIAGAAPRVLAAHRAGLGRVLLPAGNLGEARDALPSGARASIEVASIEHADEALRDALIDIVIARAGVDDAIREHGLR